MIPLRARRLLAALLAGAGLGALLAGALRHDLPVADSLLMAGQFWRAGPRGRLLNAPGLARDAAFVAEAVRFAATLPPDDDAALSVGPLVPADAREQLRRKVAYVLAPRRVVLETGAGTGITFGRAPSGAHAR